MLLVPRLGNTRCTRDEFPSFAFCRMQQEPIRRFLGTMASKSLSRSTSSCYLSSQFQSQPGNIWNIIRIAMSAAIKFLTGGGETPWNLCPDGCIAVSIIAILCSEATCWKRHVERAYEPTRVEGIPQQFPQGASMGCISFEESYDLHQQMMFGYKLAQHRRLSYPPKL
jgi:hypothetical protein